MDFLDFLDFLDVLDCIYFWVPGSRIEPGIPCFKTLRSDTLDLFTMGDTWKRRDKEVSDSEKQRKDCAGVLSEKGRKEKTVHVCLVEKGRRKDCIG